MRGWSAIVELAAEAINAAAVLIILGGTLEVLVTLVRAFFKRLSEDGAHQAWQRYARWLVAGLTFQLAADVIQTAVTTDWQTIGRVAAITVIRTFLNYSLEREVQQQRREWMVGERRPPPQRDTDP